MVTLAAARPPRPESNIGRLNRGRSRTNVISNNSSSDNNEETSLFQMPNGVPFDAFHDVTTSNEISNNHYERTNNRKKTSTKYKRTISSLPRSSTTSRPSTASSSSMRSLSPLSRRILNEEEKRSEDEEQLLINDGKNHHWESVPIETQHINTIIPPPTPPSTFHNETSSPRSPPVEAPSAESDSLHPNSYTSAPSEYGGEDNTAEEAEAEQPKRHRRSFFRSNSRNRVRSRSPFIERVLGDKVPDSQRIFPKKSSSLPTSLPPIHGRTPLPSTIFHNPATNFWIATINLNQKSATSSEVASTTNLNKNSKYLRAFSYPTEQEAQQGSLAYSPPIMLPFSSHPNCFLCSGKFALFRRAKHCRNCGVCVCSNCSTTWPRKMIPTSFNSKQEKIVNICKSCNWLCRAFQEALTEGNEDQAKALYLTNNINLRCPFAFDKTKEQFFPIHCAVQGGNLRLFKWLLEETCCPIRLSRTSVNSRHDSKIDNPILTSKGRSVLQIAMQFRHVDIIRYLVVEQKVNIYEMKDLKVVLSAFDKVIKSMSSDSHATITESKDSQEFVTVDEIYKLKKKKQKKKSTSSSTKNPYDKNTSFESHDDDDSDDMTVTSVADACILCYEKSIDCVITPCGHQICCMECSASLDHCPVCLQNGTFIRIYKP